MSEFHHMPKDFFDVEYRHAYAEDFLNTKIATQIRVLREQHGLTQGDLAKRIGTQQPGIARLENVNYSAWKVETLRKIARAFDVVFICGFVSFSTFLDEAEKFGRKALEQPSFENEIAGLAAEQARVLVGGSPQEQQSGQIPIQLVNPQMVYQSRPRIVTTPSISLPIPSGQSVFGFGSTVSGVITTRTIARTTDLAWSGENKRSLSSIDLRIEALDSYIPLSLSAVS